MARQRAWTLPEGLVAPRAARALLARAVSGLRPEMAGAAELLTSELVSNAVRHGRPPVELVVDDDGEVVRIEVRDHGSGSLPAPTATDPQRLRMPRPEACGGRGLPLLALLAEQWGSRLDGTGGGERRHVVWFTLRRPAGG